MATTFVISCPECEKQVRVSEEHIGKKIKCKDCGHIFPIQAPKGSGGEKKGPPPIKKEGKGAPPPPVPAKKGDDDDEANPYALTKDLETLPRCPFCAKEMPSLEAIICLHCGYNTRTRTRPEVKAVHQTTFMEHLVWLLPGILCVLTIIGFIVYDIIFFMNIEAWMKDSWFQDGDGWIAGFNPGFFKLYNTLLLVFLSVPLVRIGYKRLVINNKPPERKIKED